MQYITLVPWLLTWLFSFNNDSYGCVLMGWYICILELLPRQNYTTEHYICICAWLQDKNISYLQCNKKMANMVKIMPKYSNFLWRQICLKIHFRIELQPWKLVTLYLCITLWLCEFIEYNLGSICEWSPGIFQVTIRSVIGLHWIEFLGFWLNFCAVYLKCLS